MAKVSENLPSGDEGFDEAKLVKMEKHKQTKNAFWRQNLWDPLRTCTEYRYTMPGSRPFVYSLIGSFNVSPACSHTFYPWVGKIPWREKWIFARRIPWTEEPKGLQSMGRKESDTAEATEHAPRFGVHSLIDGHLAIWSCYEWNCQKGWRTSLCVNMVFISLG